MTLAEMKKYDRDWLTCDQVSEVLGCTPHSVRIQAHEDETRLGFPVIVLGTRVRIPRIPFIQFMEGTT